MRYLVAVDGGAVSDAAFKTVCATMRKEDDLILVHIVPDMAKKYAVTALEHAPAVSLVSNEAQESINERGKKVLDAYIRRAKDAGLTHIKGVLGVSTHEGEFICRLAANRDVDFIYLGRRGLNNFSRFFMGSTSKYVMENAETNVCIVKAPADKEGDATPAAGKERAYHGEAIDVKHP